MMTKVLSCFTPSHLKTPLRTNICLPWQWTKVKVSPSYPIRKMIINPPQDLEDQPGRARADPLLTTMMMMMIMVATKWWRTTGKRSRCWQRAIGLLYTLKPHFRAGKQETPSKADHTNACSSKAELINACSSRADLLIYKLGWTHLEYIPYIV